MSHCGDVLPTLKEERLELKGGAYTRRVVELITGCN
jgi:hypothetical protein